MKFGRQSILAFVSLATLLLAANACRAMGPRATFALRDGWVTLTVTHDDLPVNEARIRVFDVDYHPFANGETGPEGRGVFPLPRGRCFTVLITVGDRTADPIRLLSEQTSLFPSEVLLSFGLTPCCRVPAPDTRVRSEEIPILETPLIPRWLCAATAGSAVLLFLCVIAVRILSVRRDGNEPGKRDRHEV